MSETDNRITFLFERYVTNTCTREELEELLAAVKQRSADDALRLAMEQHWRNSSDGAGIPDAEAKLEHLFTNTRLPADQQEQESRTPVIPVRRAYRWRYAAAAVVALGLGAMGYLYQQRSPTPSAIAHHNILKQDVPPGGNKAVLTLADGSTVALDSASGRVMQQGNTSIHLQNGRLQYDVNGTTAAAGFNALVTPRGGQYQLVLPDGSKVWLNADSRLKYPTAFVGKERVVELEGQGYFEIAKKAGQPFKVRVHNLEVLALGTSFDIMAYDDERTMNATLLDGAVKVSVNREATLLKPGQQAAVVRGADAIAVSKVNTDHVIAWKNGYFSFVDADIQTIMRQLSRWYNVEVSYADGVPQGIFSGEIGKGLTLAQALQTLEQARVHFKIEHDRHIIILPE